MTIGLITKLAKVVDKLLVDAGIRQDLASSAQGLSLLGVLRAQVSVGVRTAGQWFNASEVGLWEYGHLVVKTNPDDSTTWDWSPALQAAIDYARINGGGTVTIHPGDYYLSSTVVANSLADQGAVRIIGTGAKGSFLGNKPTRLIRAPGLNHTLLTGYGRGLCIENLTFHGNHMRGHLCVISRGFEFTMKDCRFIDAPGYGFLGKALSNACIERVNIDRCSTDFTFTDGAMTSGDKTLSSASAPFSPGDVGAIVSVPGAGAAGDELLTTIDAYISPTQVTLRATPLTTVTAVTFRFGCAAFRFAGNASAEFVSNTSIIKDLHIERGAGVDFDVAYGNNTDDLAEFTLVSGLHIEAAIDNSTLTSFKTTPLIRIGNSRGLHVTNFFTYGGRSPHILVDKRRDGGANAMHGATFINGTMLGYVSNGAVTADTPDRLIDLVQGNEFTLQNVNMDTALVEHVRVRSTFGPKAWFTGINHRTRASATTTYVTDDRVDATATRAKMPMPPSEFNGDVRVSGPAIRLVEIDTPTGNVASLRVSTGGLARWDIRKSSSAEAGSNAGSDLEIVRRTDAGGSLGNAVTIFRSTGSIAVEAGSTYTCPLMLGPHRLWVNTAGKLYIKSGSNPTSDVDGTVVGSQT